MAEKKPRYWLHKFILVLSWCALVCVVMRAHKSSVVTAAMFLAAGCVLLLLIPGRLLSIPTDRRPSWKQIVLIALFAIGFFFQFRGNWLSVSKLRRVILRLGPWWPVLINALAVLGTAATLPLLWKLIEEGRRVFERIRAAGAAGEERVGKVPMRWFRPALAALILCLQLHILQTGVVPFPQNLYQITFSYYLVNIGILLAVSLALVIFLQRWSLAMLVSSVIFSVWGVANHYVTLFHGSPLMLSEFKSAGAAMDVIGDYRITFRQIPWFILALVCVLFYVVGVFRAADSKKKPFRWPVLAARAGVLAALTAAAWAILLRPGANQVLSWSYARGVSKSGFLACLVQDEEHALHPVRRPAGYDASLLPEAETVADDPSAVHPDIILILNEAFCDLDYYTPMRADSDYLAPFYETEGAVFGHSVSPSIGGGTNNSEFELLTAGSFYLMQAPAPFTYLDFTRINCSSVEYLERLGYTTFGCHLRGRTNYNRHVAYPALGFDQIQLGGVYTTEDRYGNRAGLDSEYYRYLISRYEAYTDDAPRFMYMLTYQNHGGYDKNDPSFDTVHTGSDLGESTQPVNEFLTSMAMSAEAFRDLVAYFSTVDRPVILCMVGDHAPSIISQIPAEQERSSAREQLDKRVIPYVIWSNYGADLSACPEYTSTFGLMPEVLRAAGLPLTPFYRAVLDMKEEFPVFVSSGLVMGADGTIRSYDPEDPAFRSVTEYLYMEYNAMTTPEDYREELFLPKNG